MTPALLSACCILLLMAVFVLWCGVVARENTVVNLLAENDAYRAAILELVHEREDARRMIAMKDKQISGHLRDTSILLVENQWLKRHGPDALDTEALIEDVEAMLAGEAQL